MRRALADAKVCTDPVGALDCYIALSILASRALEMELLQEILEEGMSLAQSCGDPGREYMLLANCGVCYMRCRELDRAETLLRKAKEISRGAGDFVGASSVIDFNLGYVALMNGDYEQAERCVTSALNDNERAGRRAGVVDCFAALGELAIRKRQTSEARHWAARALSEARRLKYYVDERDLIENLIARIRFDAGQWEKALTRLEHAAVEGRRGNVPLHLTAQLTRVEFLAKLGFAKQALEVKRELCEYAIDRGATWYVKEAEALCSKFE